MKKIFRQIRLYRCQPERRLELLYVEDGIPAGFPSPAADYISPAIDLNEELIEHPTATFIGRASGEICFDGLREGDVILVDTSLKIKDKDLVLCIIDGEIMIKKISKTKGVITLEESGCSNDVMIIGVVTYTIHACRMSVENDDYDASQLEEITRSNILNNEYPQADLNRLFIKHPASTFFSRVAGDSLKDAGVCIDDVVIVDKSLFLTHRDIAVCYTENSFTLKFVQIDTGGIWLMPANPFFSPIKVENEDDFRIWGVVTFIIKKRRKKK